MASRAGFSVRTGVVGFVMFAVLRGLLGDGEERDASGKPKVTLAKALKRGWLELWYQPKVSLQTQKLIGAEGLIRVRHPELGVLPPAAFLPGASDADMLAMTERVIGSALHDWHECAAAGLPAIRLAVNVPANAFVQLPITQLIKELRPKSTEWPGLILEVTEDQVVNDLKMANEVANELRSLNCSLAIDDFGAGYSSLARLRQLPFSELKIDRAYVTDCDTDKMNAGMLETIVEMAHRFGLKTVAEGIETPGQLAAVSELSCDLGQGFFLGRPAPRDDVLRAVPDGVVLPSAYPTAGMRAIDLEMELDIGAQRAG
jgi:EAL domain-containing protein (putative c-di-GMP-specific phosphodiesterase class I)